MPRTVLPRLAWCVVVLLVVSRAAAEPEEASLTAIWQKVATYFSKESLWSLDALPATRDAGAQRERDFCRAVVELDQQPLTEGRLDRVEQQLKTMVAATTAKDGVTHAALYLLGRIAQIYRAKPNVGEAAGWFRQLAADPAAGHWGDLARVKLAVLELYALPAAGPEQRLAAVDALIHGAMRNDPATVRDLHRLAARGVMFYNLPPDAALQHLLAADKIGGLTGTPAADQLVQIGELAWDTGRVELAKDYYARLRAEYPRDPRCYVMDERLAGEAVPQRWKELHGR